MPRPTPLTLRKKQSITAASAIIIVVCGSLLLWQAHRARESARRIDHTNHVLRTADEILLRLVDAETGQRGYLISGAPRFLAPYGGARADVAREMAELRALTEDDSSDGSRIASLDALVAARFAALDTLIALRRAGPLPPATVIALLEPGRMAMDSARAVIRAIRVHEDSLLAARTDADSRRARLVVVAIIGGTLLTVLCMVLLDRALIRDAEAQSEAAQTLERQNARLGEQAREMGLQQEQLRQQASALERSNEELRSTTEKLAAANGRLEDANRELRVIEARTTAVLNSTLDCVVSMDGEGRITEFNSAAESTFGYERAEVMGRRLSDVLIPPAQRSAHEAGVARYLATGEPRMLGRQVEVSALRKDGTQFPAELAVTRVKESDPPLFTGVLRDVSEARRIRAEREQLIAALQRSNQELDQFAYVASHDLKAPLRGIANLSSWIEEDLGDAVDSPTREKLDLLRGRVQRMDALIDGILQYSRAGRKPGKPERVDTGALANEVAELLAPSSDVSILVASDMPEIVTDKVPLQQVFLNLIGNAVKHAGRAGARVAVGWCERGNEMEFSVADNGPGIAPRYQDRIFGIFQTLVTRDKVEGAGIGLAVVKKIVEAKGGRVWIESSEGEGATFHFTWPKREKAV